jgi:hypothetical protein
MTPIDKLNCEYLPIAAFPAAMEAAQPGECFVYFIGRLDHARDQLQVPPKQMPHEVEKLARTAWRFSKDRQICLTQRRLGPARFEYLATRRV